MYAIKSGGKVVGYSDTVVYVRLHENGCYVPCDEAEAEGFCIKTAIDRTDEETNETTTYLEDFVYASPTADSSVSSRSAPWKM